MKAKNTLNLESVFFEALNYPEFALPNFYINKQKESEWSKGVFLTELSKVYHNALTIFDAHFEIKKRSLDNPKIEDFKLAIKEVFKIDTDYQIDKKTTKIYSKILMSFFRSRVLQ